VFTVDDWPEHVTFEQEQSWIVVDDTTLKRPPKKKHSIDNKRSPLTLTQSCPTGGLESMKVIASCMSYILLYKWHRIYFGGLANYENLPN